MMTKRTVTTARILMVIYLIALAVLCFWDFSKLPDISTVKWFGFYKDKVIHFLMFLPFPPIFYFAAGRKTGNPWGHLAYTLGIFLTGSLIGAVTEIGQKFIKYRCCDPADFKADALALAISSLAVFIIGIIQNMMKKNA